jgi:hypothetical protein
MQSMSWYFALVLRCGVHLSLALMVCYHENYVLHVPRLEYKHESMDVRAYLVIVVKSGQ